ncbi:MAG: hypothetical protein KGM44_08085, partial [bacterium]|nr:hypothetical protein [bacterium]
LNECSPAHRDELLKGAVAFALQCDARAILTAHAPLVIPGLTVERLTLELPNDSQKRQIYAFHAGLRPSAELDALCGGFRNAYELTIAGRCHSVGGRPPGLAFELYDRYVTECLPTHCSAVAGGLARYLATEMGNRGSLHLPRHDCDVLAERFLAEHRAPLTALDDLLRCPLMDVAGDIVTFEHELLFTYMRASALHHNTTSIGELCANLRLPRNQTLVEFILPRVTACEEINAVLAVCEYLGVLKAYEGRLGALARAAVVDACEKFVRDSIAELDKILVRFITTRTDEGRLMLVDIELDGLDDLTDFEKNIAQVIARRVDGAAGRARLLKILDETEAALRSAVSLRAKEEGAGVRQAWSEVMRLWVGLSRPTQMRGTLVIANLKERVSGFSRERFDPELRGELVARALAEPAGTFALYLLLQELEFHEEDAEMLVSLVERAWATQIHYLRMTALFALMNARSAAGSEPALQSRVAEFLDSIETHDMVLSSMIVEAQSHFETIEPPVSSEDALAEMRATIEWNVPVELRVAFDETSQNAAAYSLLSRIFEEVFQGAYFNAYQQLSDEERFRILTLAAGAPSQGFYGDWIMHELLRLDKIEALPTFRAAATAIDLRSSFPQGETAIFVLGLYAFARYAEAPPVRPEPTSTLERAWFLVGDALFWAFHDRGRHAGTRGAEVLKRLDGDVLLSAAIVLSDLHDTHWNFVLEGQRFPTFAAVWPDVARRIATHGIAHRERIAALKERPVRFNDVAGYLVKTLGEIGDASSIPVLRSVMDDPAIGRAAIESIRAIETREIGTRT